MKIIINFCIILLYIISGDGENTHKELYKLEKPKNGFYNMGTHSYLNVLAQGPVASSLPAKIELKGLEEGFLIRDELHLIYFDDEFNKVWEKDIETKYKVRVMPQSILEGNRDIAYFIEVKTFPRNTHLYVNSISKNGSHVHKEFELEKENLNFMDFFINKNNELCRIGVVEDKKAKKLIHTIYKIDATLNVSEDIIPLPVNEYEVQKKTGLGDAGSRYFWSYLGKVDNNVVLVKSYFQLAEKKKNNHLILETIEVSPDNTLLNHKIWPFDAYIIDEDRKFVTPTIVFDEIKKEILLTGYLAVNDKSLNGSYIIKYDYATQDRIYNREYSIKELLKNKKPENKVHFEIPPQINNMIPLNIPLKDIVVSHKNQTVNIKYITNIVAASRWTSTYLSVTFDKYGDLIETDVIGFDSNYYMYANDLKPLPIFLEKIYKDNSRTHLASNSDSSVDFVKKNLIKTRKEEQYYIPLERKDKSLIIIYDEEKGNFQGVGINH